MEQKEIQKQAMQAKTPEELLTLAKEHGIELTEEQAKVYFDQFHRAGELSDKELTGVSGGDWSDDCSEYPVLSGPCQNFELKPGGKSYQPHECSFCRFLFTEGPFSRRCTHPDGPAEELI